MVNGTDVIAEDVPQVVLDHHANGPACVYSPADGIISLFSVKLLSHDRLFLCRWWNQC